MSLAATLISSMMLTAVFLRVARRARPSGWEYMPTGKKGLQYLVKVQFKTLEPHGHVLEFIAPSAALKLLPKSKI